MPDGRVDQLDLTRVLACATIEPGLRTVILFDGTPATVQSAAKLWATLLRAQTDGEVRVVTFGSGESDDDIWGRLELRRQAAGTDVAWQAGRLVPDLGDCAPRVVVVPDLARLGLPAARACVALVGAEVAGLQRHGHSVVWAPNLYWVAGCRRSAVGEVSPHLLDRFALRLSAPPPLAIDRSAAVRGWAMNDKPTNSLPVPTNEHVQGFAAAARHPSPAISTEICYHILAYFPSEIAPGSRRPLALSRLSRALARWELRDTVTLADVRIAATLIGISPPIQSAERFATSPNERHVESTLEPTTQSPGNELTGSAAPGEPVGGVSVHEPATELTAKSMPVASDPYPEDSSPIEREAESLRWPSHRELPSGAAHGSVIGTCPATDLRDVAVVSSVLEAAKFRMIRPAPAHGSTPINIIRADLRSYRRTRVPGQLLVLVLDYTCVGNRDWAAALLPHLRWAYVERAGVCLVRVGVTSAKDPLRADRIESRNLLNRRIGAAIDALDDPGGTATPLAHGLELALHAIRKGLQHGRGSAHRARVVILTDGRGNVPLAASHVRAVTRPVFREGIEDAIRVARVVRGINHVETFLLDPTPAEYGDLPGNLAEALGASITVIPQAPDETQETKELTAAGAA